MTSNMFKKCKKKFAFQKFIHTFVLTILLNNFVYTTVYGE